LPFEARGPATPGGAGGPVPGELQEVDTPTPGPDCLICGPDCLICGPDCLICAEFAGGAEPVGDIVVSRVARPHPRPQPLAPRAPRRAGTPSSTERPVSNTRVSVYNTRARVSSTSVSVSSTAFSVSNTRGRVYRRQPGCKTSSLTAASGAWRPPPCRCRAHFPSGFFNMLDSGLVGSTVFHSSHPQGHEGGVPREQKMLKGHLPRVVHHRVYLSTRR